MTYEELNTLRSINKKLTDKERIFLNRIREDIKSKLYNVMPFVEEYCPIEELEKSISNLPIFTESGVAFSGTGIKMEYKK